jgi:hypothetical protein
MGLVQGVQGSRVWRGGIDDLRNRVRTEDPAADSRGRDADSPSGRAAAIGCAN